MSKVVCLIDGFNLYHSIAEAPALTQYKWLDLQSFSRSFTKAEETLVDVYYFTSIAFWNYAKQEKHKRYIRVLEDRGVRVVCGNSRTRRRPAEFAEKPISARRKSAPTLTSRITLFRLAYENR